MANASECATGDMPAAAADVVRQDLPATAGTGAHEAVFQCELTSTRSRLRGGNPAVRSEASTPRTTIMLEGTSMMDLTPSKPPRTSRGCGQRPPAGALRSSEHAFDAIRSGAWLTRGTRGHGLADTPEAPQAGGAPAVVPVGPGHDVADPPRPVDGVVLGVGPLNRLHEVLVSKAPCARGRRLRGAATGRRPEHPSHPVEPAAAGLALAQIAGLTGERDHDVVGRSSSRETKPPRHSGSRRAGGLRRVLAGACGSPRLCAPLLAGHSPTRVGDPVVEAVAPHP